MPAITIGAFEAKTRLPELLRDVQQGGSVTITHRGQPVARLIGYEEARSDEPARALAYIREARKQYKVSAREVLTWRDEGRRL